MNDVNRSTVTSRSSENFIVSIPAKIWDYGLDLWEAWQRFWFTPLAPHTLAVMRIATGAMLTYMHLIWASDLMAFLGPNAWLNRDVARQLHATDYTWSYLNYIDSPALLWSHHSLMILVAVLFTLGIATKVTAPLAWFLNLMYCHRLTGHLFGLDQVVMMLLMYLMIAPCGSVYSVDAWRNKKQGFSIGQETVAARIATRLIQLHLCIVYLFGGISKMRGELWWDGSAIWYALVNWEYQSIDAVWLGHYPLLIGAISHVTIFWETFYCAAIWPRFLRPWTLAIAVAVHGGIALVLGMITFGVMMLVANLSFVAPETIDSLVSRRRAN